MQRLRHRAGWFPVLFTPVRATPGPLGATGVTEIREYGSTAIQVMRTGYR